MSVEDVRKEDPVRLEQNDPQKYIERRTVDWKIAWINGSLRLHHAGIASKS